MLAERVDPRQGAARQRIVGLVTAALLGLVVGGLISRTLVDQGAVAPEILVLSDRAIGVGPYVLVWAFKGIIVVGLVQRRWKQLEVATLRAVPVGTLAGFAWWLVASLTLSRIAVGEAPSWSLAGVVGTFPHLVAVIIGFPAIAALWTVLGARGVDHDPDAHTGPKERSAPPDLVGSVTSALAIALVAWCVGPLTIAPILAGRPITWSASEAVVMAPALITFWAVATCAAIVGWAVLHVGARRPLDQG